MPTASRKTTSAATPVRTFGSGESMKLPPYLTTNVELRKRCMYGNASTNTSAFLMRSCMKRANLLALVQFDVFFRQVTCVHRAASTSEMKMNVDNEGRLCDDLPQLCQRRARGHAAANGCLAVVGNVHEILIHSRARITQGIQDSAPIRIATAPTCFHE